MNNNNNNNNNDTKKDHLIQAKRPDLIMINNYKKKRTCKIVDFTVPVDHGIKMKQIEKKNSYLEFAREFKKNEQCNMKMTIIPIVIGAFGTVTSGDHPNYGIIENS